jgi:hypothetical protein
MCLANIQSYFHIMLHTGIENDLTFFSGMLQVLQD